MTDPASALTILAGVEPVEFRCPECERLIFKAKAQADVVVEAKCPRCSTISTALLPAIENAAP